MGNNKKKINLLFVLLQISTGGVERVVLDLARNLDRSLFNIYIAFFSNGNLYRDLSEVCRGLFHIEKKPGFDPGAMLQLSRIIKDKSIDAINPHHYAPFFYSFLGSKILHRRSLIYTEHSVAELERITGKHEQLCKRWFFRNTDAIVGVSWEVTKSFKKRFPAYSDKMIDVPNGVDVDRFSTPIDRTQVRAEWKLSPEHFVIGTIANLRKVKNHACLIRAFSRLNAVYPRTR